MKRAVLVVSLAVGILSAQQAMAQSSMGFKSIGASVGYVSPENLDGTVGFGIFADIGHPSPQISIEPSIEYWSQSQTEFGAKVSISDIAVGARGKYFFETANPNLRPFAGAGLGMHFLHSAADISVPGFPTISSDASDTKLGLNLGGGLETSLSPKVNFHAEMWYGIVTDVSQLSLRVGLSRKLGI